MSFVPGITVESGQWNSESVQNSITPPISFIVLHLKKLQYAFFYLSLLHYYSYILFNYLSWQHRFKIFRDLDCKDNDCIEIISCYDETTSHNPIDSFIEMSWSISSSRSYSAHGDLYATTAANETFFDPKVISGIQNKCNLTSVTFPMGIFQGHLQSMETYYGLQLHLVLYHH